ncbi:MAG: endonuclease NucS domain-containing protein [Promethearchaeota archaeon]
MFFFDEEERVSESEIQILYQNHPYLIEEQFFQQKVIPQYPLPSGFADLVVFLDDEIVVIELKVVPLDETHILQLNGYMEDINKKFKDIKKIRGILVGYPPAHELENAIIALKFEIKVMILERDLPIEIKICSQCRRLVDYKLDSCPYCLSFEFL